MGDRLGLIAVAVISLLLAACSEEGISSPTKVAGRWYSPQQVEQGRTLFIQNCAACHGKNSAGTPAWKTPLADGSYPPPPLNGTAHAWHHPKSILLRTIEQGGIPLGGKMPGFAGRLDTEQQQATIAYFQSFWDDKIYAAWLQRGGLN